jgi:hypothetical protein
VPLFMPLDILGKADGIKIIEVRAGPSQLTACQRGPRAAAAAPLVAR